MPGSLNKYDEKQLLAVKVSSYTTGTGQNATVNLQNYGFWSNVERTKMTELGQTLIGPDLYNNPPAGLFIGANYPKPARATKRINNEIYSTFCSADKVAALTRDNWRVVSPILTPPRKDAADTRALVQGLWVKVRGIKYGWNSPDITVEKITAAEYTKIGVSLAVEADEKEMIYGSSFPRPPRAKKSVTDGGNTNVHSSFYDPDKFDQLEANGWQHTQNGVMRILGKR